MRAWSQATQKDLLTATRSATADPRARGVHCLVFVSFLYFYLTFRSFLLSGLSWRDGERSWQKRNGEGMSDARAPKRLGSRRLSPISGYVAGRCPVSLFHSLSEIPYNIIIWWNPLFSGLDLPPTITMHPRLHTITFLMRFEVSQPLRKIGIKFRQKYIPHHFPPNIDSRTQFYSQ